MTFEEAVEIVLKHEGGYSNLSADPGGETNFGISKRAYPDLNIKALTRDKAIEIYRRDYWEKLAVGVLPVPVRLLYFDCAVNQGPGRAKELWRDAQMVEGDKEQAIRFAKLRLNHYVSMSLWKTFGAGWAKRLFDVALHSVA